MHATYLYGGGEVNIGLSTKHIASLNNFNLTFISKLLVHVRAKVGGLV